MRNRANSLFALGSTIVVFALVIAGVFGAVQLIDRWQGPHVPSGWAYVEYAMDGDLSDAEQEAVARSIVFRMHMGRSSDARWWVHEDTVTVAVSANEKGELESLPSSGPELHFGGVIAIGRVGEGEIEDVAQCHDAPENYACDRDRNLWFHLSQPALKGSDISRAEVVEDKAGTGAYAVEMTLDGEAEKTLQTTTKRMAKSTGEGQRLAVVYGGIVLSAEPVQEPITDGVVRLPGFSKSEGRDLASAVRASKYDVTLDRGPVKIAD